MPKLKPLPEQVVVITGASSGIGRVTARSFAAHGAKVMCVARNEGSLQEVVSEIEAAGGDAVYAVADVGDADQVRAAAEAAIDRFGRIDTWVSNAGTAIYGKLIDTPLAEHEQLFRTNYLGAVNSALTAIPHLKVNGGAIITIGSIASEMPSPILSAYSASKHAVKGFVDALRMEVHADGLPIGITLIMPAGIDTPIAQHAANHVDGEGLIPPPVYDPQLVADAILDAAVTVRRNVTVGGIGRLQVLVGTHFPVLFDKLSGVFVRVLSDSTRPATRSTTIFAPEQPGRERSGIQSGRRFSLYTFARRHRFTTNLLILGTLAGGVGLLARRRLRAG